MYLAGTESADAVIRDMLALGPERADRAAASAEACYAGRELAAVRSGATRQALADMGVGRDPAPDWSQSLLRRITPNRVERQVQRMPEATLVMAILLDAHDRCAFVAKALARVAAGTWSERGNTDKLTVAKLLAEGRELFVWLTSDSHELQSLGWVCDVLSTTSGQPMSREATGAQLLRVLAGEVIPLRMNAGHAGSRTTVSRKSSVDRYEAQKARRRREARG